MPESAPRAVRTTLRAVRRSLRAAARIVAAGPQVERGGFRLDLSTHLISVVKLVTQDLMLASAAETATLEASRRQDFSGSLIVFAGTSSVADVWLQRRGAVTLDFVHGSTSSEWVGLHESPSSIRAVWTYPDADANSALGRDVVVGGMPRRVARRARRVALSRVLILSNYVHRDAVTVFGYPLAPFQDELLDVVPLIVDAFAGRFRVRWRPHPADDEGAVRHTLLRHSNVELARSHTLEEDVDWADVVISSLSSATIEATLADVPIFVHAIPVFQKAATQIGFCPERCFFHAREFLPRFQSCIRRMDANDPNALEPERRLRSRLFGPSGAPDTLMEALARRSNAGQVASSLNALLLRKRYIA